MDWPPYTRHSPFTDNNGYLTGQEIDDFVAMIEKANLFKLADLDGDGKISKEEWVKSDMAKYLVN